MINDKRKQTERRRRLAKRGIGLALGLALVTVAGCRTSKQSSEGSFSLGDKVQYSAAYDRELDSIFRLSEKGKWEEAEAEVGLLLQQHPEDTTLSAYWRVGGHTENTPSPAGHRGPHPNY